MTSHPEIATSLATLGARDEPPHFRKSFHEALATNVVRFKVAAQRLGLPEATLRDLRFYAEDRQSADGQTIHGNGFSPAFLKLGRALYVDLEVFMQVWRSQQLKEVGHD